MKRNLPELAKSERRDLFRPMGDPFRTINSLQREVDRVLDHMGGLNWPVARQDFLNDFAPAVDVEDLETHFLLVADLPGLSKEDVKIEVNPSQITISGERKEEAVEKKGVSRTERFCGFFQRSFALPMEIDPERVEAHFENGVLRIALPKVEAVKSKVIPIGETKSGGLLSRFIANRKERQEKIA